MRLTAAFFLFFPLSLAADPTDKLPQSPALAVTTAYLFPDTSLSAVSTEVVREGTLLEVLGKSATEQLDKDQNQQFFWYLVRTPDGKTGWYFGDGLASMQTEAQLPENLRFMHRKPAAFGQGFEDATLWWAAIEGHDSEAYDHAFFGEYYLVVTNASGRSAYLRYAGKSAQGETSLLQIFYTDLTGDGRPEFALETCSRDRDRSSESRFLEIFQIQNGNFHRIFSENLTLTDPDDFPAPSLFKCVDIEPKTIRVEYVEFLDCSKYSLKMPAEAENTPGQCLEFVTYTYSWNTRTGRFELLYEPTRLAPTAAAVYFGISVRTTPAVAGDVVSILSGEDKLQIIKQFDKIVVENGRKKTETYLFVRLPDGRFGFVAGAKIVWQKIRHARLLESYYQNPPLLRSEWHAEFPFVRLTKPSGAVGGF